MQEQPSVNLFTRVGLPVLYIAVLLLSIILTVFFIRERLSVTPDARSGERTGAIVSLDNSYVFSSPVRAKAGGDLIRVTVFVLDEQGLSIGNSQVRLNASEPALNIKQVQPVTDETGKAIFDIGSDKVGIYYLEVSVEGDLLEQKAKLLFD
jgi:hypothetical protein